MNTLTPNIFMLFFPVYIINFIRYFELDNDDTESSKRRSVLLSLKCFKLGRVFKFALYILYRIEY